MPPLLAALPAIASIAGLAGTGVGLAESIKSGDQSKDAAASQTSALQAQQQQAQQLATQQQNQQRQQLASQQAPNILSATSGLAVPDYLLSALTSSAGPSPGLQSVLNSNFGSGASQFQPAGLSGGSASATTPANLSDLTTQILYG